MRITVIGTIEEQLETGYVMVMRPEGVMLPPGGMYVVDSHGELNVPLGWAQDFVLEGGRITADVVMYDGEPVGDRRLGFGALSSHATSTSYLSKALAIYLQIDNGHEGEDDVPADPFTELMRATRPLD